MCPYTHTHTRWLTHTHSHSRLHVLHIWYMPSNNKNNNNKLSNVLQRAKLQNAAVSSQKLDTHMPPVCAQCVCVCARECCLLVCVCVCEYSQHQRDARLISLWKGNGHKAIETCGYNLIECQLTQLSITHIDEWRNENAWECVKFMWQVLSNLCKLKKVIKVAVIGYRYICIFTIDMANWKPQLNEEALQRSLNKYSSPKTALR